MRFRKKLPLPQKLMKNLHGMTWPPHLQFASYDTVYTCSPGFSREYMTFIYVLVGLLNYTETRSTCSMCVSYRNADFRTVVYLWRRRKFKLDILTEMQALAATKSIPSLKHRNVVNFVFSLFWVRDDSQDGLISCTCKCPIANYWPTDQHTTKQTD